MSGPVYEGSLGATVDITGGTSNHTSVVFTMPVVVNGLMIVTALWPSDPGTVTFDWDSAGTPQAMTLIPGALGSNTVFIKKYAVLAPHSGNLSLHVTTTNTLEIIFHATGYSNVDQTSVAIACPNGTVATGTGVTTPSVTISSAVGSLTEDGVGTSSSGVPGSPTQTSIQTLSGGGPLDFGSSRETDAAGASSVTHAWGTPAGTWVSVGTSIKGVAVAPDGYPIAPQQRMAA